jgi:hypothetical protein
MRADTRSMGRPAFSPLGVGVFLLVDMTRRATGH